jgi:hypothetical protein
MSTQMVGRVVVAEEPRHGVIPCRRCKSGPGTGKTAVVETT